ncbi:trypsin-like peptidase domain-containing protein [Phenylobacterium sp.]|jgi:hypothetical protein|uniref:trypsin-like peptidase domain-containing protein n=1 Tax=Phenylobacterium sp. TaxID=1871053 RepID=UPI002F406CFD
MALGVSLALTAGARAQVNFEHLFPSIVRVAGLGADDNISLGSGVVVASTDTGSYVITNYHVIADADASQIRVVAPQGETGDKTTVSPARFVSGDSATDIAVLYVANFFAPALPLAVGPTPENLAVRAIGYPGTDIGQWRVLKTRPTITDGIVSTSQTAPWRPGLPAVGQVQHTAALNEGMSGGPLLDLCGRVVAIDTAYNGSARGVNLSLSAADVTPYLQRQNIAYTASKTACDPNASNQQALAQAQAQAQAQVQSQQAQQVAAQVKMQRESEEHQRSLMLAGGAALAVVVLGGGAALLLRRRGAAAPVSDAVAAPIAPAGPPHGLALRGVNQASGKTQIVRREDLMGDVGFEIGRNAGFGSPGTSRRHARLVWSPSAGFVLRDLGSTGGTRVNGREIKGAGDQPINLGDVIEFGAPDARYSVEKL